MHNLRKVDYFGLWPSKENFGHITLHIFPVLLHPCL